MSSPKRGSVVVLVGTRKGAFVFRSDARRKSWTVAGPHFPSALRLDRARPKPEPAVYLLMSLYSRSAYSGFRVFRASYSACAPARLPMSR